MKKLNKKYRASFRIILVTSTELAAQSLEQALEIARATKVGDLIEVNDQHDDSSIAVEGVSDPDKWNIEQ